MAFRFFTVSIQDAGSAEAELNAFLGSRKVLAVDRRWVEQGASSFWSFCVEFLESSNNGAGRSSPGGRHKTDYKQLLSPDEFVLFAKLRQVRKEIAQAEAVPVYAIFTNEQLAQMVQTRATTKAALAEIEGVGEARIEKYGERVLEVLAVRGDGAHVASQSSD